MTDTTIVPLELRRDGEHTLDGLCVPYNVTTMKAGYPRGERFMPGAFRELVTAPAAKIRLTDSHAGYVKEIPEGRRPVGVATEFREEETGLYGRFRFYNTPEGRGARENVEEETYGGLSVGFLSTSERRGDDGAREVLSARLFHVSLVDEPAYEEARILAVRSAIPDVERLLSTTYNLDDFIDPPDLTRLVFGIQR